MKSLFRHTFSSILFCSIKSFSVDEVAEWLRRWTANPMCSARVGSNPILVVELFLCSGPYQQESLSPFALPMLRSLQSGSDDAPLLLLPMGSRRRQKVFFPPPGIEPGPAG